MVEQSSSRGAIVTGAGVGLGNAIARRLAADGLCLVVNDLPSKAAEIDQPSLESPVWSALETSRSLILRWLTVAQASPFSHPGWPPSQSPNSSTSACDSPSSRDPMYGHDPFASYTTPKVAAPAPALTRAQPSISGPAPSPQSPRHPHSFPPHPPTHGAVPVPSQTLVPENPPPPYSEVGPL
ncbi:hypothetical protein FISHEDRAFT_72126 [Fistulina hepatica ATCC 64428]|uniref:NAD(P)-binding protein n=1 Tax=Fistulina hepatica ATCC 64428 TaxID=1128425 RepID=A0A0D7AIC6_9AGAR|nr:hypothetical protein FISHEDRAFT_72126 [Fistulina hepatica ATCC 64428]